MQALSTVGFHAVLELLSVARQGNTASSVRTKRTPRLSVQGVAQAHITRLVLRK